MTHAVVLGRRRKGRQIAEAVDETCQRLEAAGWTTDHAVVTRKRALRKHARKAVKAKADVVVAVGGDGAVFQVVNALGETGVVLGIVPKGTGNLLAGNLDIPLPIEKAVEVLLTGEPRTIDLGEVKVSGTKRDFAVACGIGFDAIVMDATDPKQKRRWGKLAYVASAIRAGRKVEAARHEITIDGRTITTEAAQVFIANFGRIGAVVEPRRRVIADDGLFDVFVVKANGPTEGLLAGWNALRQRTLGETDDGRVLRARATNVIVSSTPPQLVETDGSVIGQTPVTARIRPAALRVMAPLKR
ncbi:MAG TPA: diacylglycerol kinase family protein [Candidatus Limnocylindrales bacterium]|nr:diacylglycerol kinase family protein [Candidatus Limnocylindrales bacterium]